MIEQILADMKRAPSQGVGKAYQIPRGCIIKIVKILARPQSDISPDNRIRSNMLALAQANSDSAKPSESENL